MRVDSRSISFLFLACFVAGSPTHIGSPYTFDLTSSSNKRTAPLSLSPRSKSTIHLPTSGLLSSHPTGHSIPKIRNYFRGNSQILRSHSTGTEEATSSFDETLEAHSSTTRDYIEVNPRIQKIVDRIHKAKVAFVNGEISQRQFYVNCVAKVILEAYKRHLFITENGFVDQDVAEYLEPYSIDILEAFRMILPDANNLEYRPAVRMLDALLNFFPPKLVEEMIRGYLTESFEMLVFGKKGQEATIPVMILSSTSVYGTNMQLRLVYNFLCELSANGDREQVLALYSTLKAYGIELQWKKRRGTALRRYDLLWIVRPVAGNPNRPNTVHYLNVDESKLTDELRRIVS